MRRRPTALQSGDALLLIDVQHDFLPGGALAVPHGSDVVPILKSYLALFAGEGLPVFATRDWHPENHKSFHDQGGPWPKHCVMESIGAAFPVELGLPADATIVSKGFERDDEGYSTFGGTNLEKVLREAGVKRVFVGGLATDYCVLHTVTDALRLGFAVFLLRDAVRAINVEPDDGAKAEAAMQRLGAVPLEIAAVSPWTPEASPLLTDWYQLTMLRGYFAAGMNDTAVFEFFVRHLPADWNFLVAAGLEQVLAMLEDFRFSDTDLAWLEGTGEFAPATIEKLRNLRFTGDVEAMAEGTIFFPDEPILRVTAPLAEAQVVETRIVNLLHFQTLIASKAARCVLAAPGKTLVEFGLRRAHGAEAGLLAARASYLAGFDSTSDVLARQSFGIPLSGTVAHSFVEACESEDEAFLRFARANPHNVVLIIDTYDTEVAAAKVVGLAPVLRAEGIAIKGVRIDSGDLAAHATRVRRILDDGGLPAVTIFASGNLDEHDLRRMIEARAPIEGFGLGTRITTAADASYLDCAYKLQAYANVPRCKHSEGKATWPAAKQVYRQRHDGGRFAYDTVALADETGQAGAPLLERVMQHGRRQVKSPLLTTVRDRTRSQLQALPEPLRDLHRTEAYRVEKSAALVAVARRLGLAHHAAATGPRIESLPHLHHGFLGRIYADAGPVAAGEEAPVVEGESVE